MTIYGVYIDVAMPEADDRSGINPTRPALLTLHTRKDGPDDPRSAEASAKHYGGYVRILEALE